MSVVRVDRPTHQSAPATSGRALHLTGAPAGRIVRRMAARCAPCGAVLPQDSLYCPGCIAEVAVADAPRSRRIVTAISATSCDRARLVNGSMRSLCAGFRPAISPPCPVLSSPPRMGREGHRRCRRGSVGLFALGATTIATMFVAYAVARAAKRVSRATRNPRTQPQTSNGDLTWIAREIGRLTEELVKKIEERDRALRELVR